MFIWIKDTFVPSRLHFKNNVMKRYCQTLDLKEDLSSTYKCNFLGADNKQ